MHKVPGTDLWNVILDCRKSTSVRITGYKQFLFAFLILVLASVSPAHAEKRIALVIGNSDYDFNPLENPGSDATAIAALLDDLDFEVFKGLELDYDSMTREVAQFLSALDRADVALLYYAGHGIQLDNENYLIPTDNPLRSESDIELRAIKVSTVLAAMERSARTSITLLDACRNNPLEDQLMQSMGKSRSAALGRGLANMQAGNGSMIVFATAPNKIAFDGAGKHSPFTQALLRYLGQQNKSLSSIVTQVTADVFSATNQRQRPYTTMSLLEDVYLAKDPDATAPLEAATKAPDQTPLTETASAETVVREATSGQPALPLADRRASTTRDDPQHLRLSEIVEGRIGEGVRHYWHATLQPGTYQVVVDSERADETRSSYTDFDIDFRNADGLELAPKVSADGYYLRARYKRVLKVGSETELVIGVGDASAVVDYDLAVLPENVAAPIPYLQQPFAVQPLVIGTKAEAQVSGKDPATSEAWYALSLDAKDYEIVVTFTDTDASGFSGGKAEMLGRSGEVLRPAKRICQARGNSATNSCSARLSLAEETQFLIKLFPQDDGPYLTGITVNELD